MGITSRKSRFTDHMFRYCFCRGTSVWLSNFVTFGSCLVVERSEILSKYIRLISASP